MTTDVPRTAAEFRKQEQDRRRREAFEQQATRFTVNLSFLPLVAYVLMLAVGAVHGFAPAIPAIGYGTTLLLVLGADALSTVTKKFRQ
ncbi:hypothetical protein [Streptomyces scabiei]|uniref:hypothetical protein n=1 Tax=Streptomyces scabiei TaxID=1930 RepID=UPI0029ABB4C3|nr:hypothetical protein [Streptomyces scabiei]MDX2794018.1 hypothetical protein [Streptomyces scabiei]